MRALLFRNAWFLRASSDLPTFSPATGTGHSKSADRTECRTPCRQEASGNLFWPLSLASDKGSKSDAIVRVNDISYLFVIGYVIFLGWIFKNRTFASHFRKRSIPVFGIAQTNPCDAGKSKASIRNPGLRSYAAVTGTLLLRNWWWKFLSGNELGLHPIGTSRVASPRRPVFAMRS